MKVSFLYQPLRRQGASRLPTLVAQNEPVRMPRVIDLCDESDEPVVREESPTDRVGRSDRRSKRRRLGSHDNVPAHASVVVDISDEDDDPPPPRRRCTVDEESDEQLEELRALLERFFHLLHATIHVLCIAARK